MSTSRSPSSSERNPRIVDGRSSWLEADVVCGSDFSAYSTQAAQAAAALAERLVIVHAVDGSVRMDGPKESWEPIAHSAYERLDNEQDVLRALHMATIETSLRSGDPVAVLLEEAAHHHAKLLIVGAAQKRANHLWPSITIAEKVAEAAEIPTLIVRQAAPFFRWVQGERRLRVFVAMDFSPPSDTALQWADWFRRTAPCEIIAAYLETDSAPTSDIGTVPSLFMNEMVLKAAHTQERLFDSKVRARFGLSHVSTRYDRDVGNSGGKLIQLAVKDEADLIVVGTHSRHGWHHIGHHSVSRFVIRNAPVNVLVCPAWRSSAAHT